MQKNTNQPIPMPQLQRRRRPAPVLRFCPTAWAKLLFFRDRGDTEIGGFGITDAEDLLYVREFVSVRQSVTMASISFDDQSVADYFDQQVDAGNKPEQFARIWLHTHPGYSPEPSGTDEATFLRVFGNCQWALMFIMAQDGKTYARLRFNIGPGGSLLIPVEVDYSQPFMDSDFAAWEMEYQAHIQPYTWPENTLQTKLELEKPFTDLALPTDIIQQLEMMDPAERIAIMDELSGRPDLWNEEELYL